MKRTLTMLGAALAVSVGFATAVPAAVVIVTPSDVGDTWFTADTRAPGTGTFVMGPAIPPYGYGSFELTTPSGSNPAKVQLFTDLYDNVPLADIDAIGYSTYRTAAPSGSPALVALNLRVDLDGNGSADVYMVFEPYQDQGNAAISDGAWQNWDAYRGGAAKWWINTNAGGCGQATPCTWTAIVTAFPNAQIREAPSCGPGAAPVSPCPGSLGFNLGSFNPGVQSAADGLYVSVNGGMTTYDFELFAVAQTDDQCKYDGWSIVKRADGSSFKNQGDCIQYVNTGK